MITRWLAILVVLVLHPGALLATQHSTKTLRGRAVLVDGNTERVLEQATFDFWIRADGAWFKREVVVRDGRFELPVPDRFSWAMPGPIDIGGRAAWTTFALENPLPSEPVTMSVSWVKPTTLHVVDGSTRADLAEIEIVRRDSWFTDPPPSDRQNTRRVGTTWTSPLELPFFETDPEFVGSQGVVGTETYWVRAPGYAWNRISIDPTYGGHRELSLWPAMLFVDGRSNLPRGVRWFTQPADRSEAPTQLKRSRAGGYWAELAPGEWLLQLRRLDEGGPKAESLLKEVSVDLDRGTARAFTKDEAGLLASRVSEALEVDPPIREHLAFELRVPKQWNAYVKEVEFSPAKKFGTKEGRRVVFDATSFERSHDDPELMRFDLHDLECGRWRVAVDGLAWSESFDVVFGAKDQVSASVGKPARVSVRVLDGDTGAPVNVKLQIASRPTSFLGEIKRHREVRALATGRFAFEAPVGVIRLLPTAGEYAHTYPELAVNTGDNELTLRLFRPIAVRVEAFDGEARLPSDEIEVVAESTVDPEAHGNIRWGIGGTQPYYEIALGRPGRWRFTCNDIAGYVTPAPIELDVSRDAVPRVIFRLQRSGR